DNNGAMGRGNRGDTGAIVRLAPGLTLQQARAEMEGIAARLAIAYPDANRQFGIALQPLRERFVGDIRPSLLILFAAVLFVLLIACANVANLFLMRSAGRTREIAMRIAIGATRGRIIRQMLAESFVLAFFGGVLGLGLAWAGIKAIASLIPPATLGRAAVTLDGAVLAFAALATVASFRACGALATLFAAVAFGLAPAMQSVRTSIQSKLKESGKSTTAGSRQHRWRSALVVGEIALSMVLLAGAGLMLKSLY